MFAGPFAVQYFFANGWHKIIGKLSKGDFLGVSDTDAENIFMRHLSFLRVVFCNLPAVRYPFVVDNENIFRACCKCRIYKQDEGNEKKGDLQSRAGP